MISPADALAAADAATKDSISRIVTVMINAYAAAQTEAERTEARYHAARGLRLAAEAATDAAALIAVKFPEPAK